MPQPYEDRILRVLKYIHDHPADDLSLDVLADVAAMSRFHWHRVFHAMTGETCAQAVRRVRLYRAAGWLVHSDKSHREIAVAVGYPNVQSFSRAFRDSFGMSPGSFRQKGDLFSPQKQIRKGMIQMYEVETQKLSQKRVCAVLHVGPYDEVGPTFSKVMTLATEHELWSDDDAIVGVHYDDPNVVDRDKLRCHAGVVVDVDATLPEGAEEVVLPGGVYAILRYQGPYTAINVAYDYLFGEWLPNSKYEPADAPCYERYLNDPESVAEVDLRTDILLPLKA